MSNGTNDSSTSKFDQAETINLVDDPTYQYVLVAKDLTRPLQHRPGPMVTLTWLEATSDDGVEQACRVLRERVQEILRKNPVYAGVLTRSDQNDGKYYS